MTRYHSLHWLDPESSGYVDVFPYEAFQSEGDFPGFQHLVLGPRGKNYRAKCNLSVSTNTADLNYEVYPDLCRQYGWYEGTLRFSFKDARRIEIVMIEWRHKGESFAKAAAKLEPYTPAPLDPYKLSKTTVTKSSRAVKERAGQVRFREKLLLAYAGKCCLSACHISAALEGAHIDPFYGPASDHPQNGLLLRHDLHDLFDAGLLAIAPSTLVAYVAPEVHQCKDYAAMHGHALTLPIQKDCQPSREALNRRWMAFEKRFGKIGVQQSVSVDVSASRGRL